jgi:serine/threonine-protein kinase
MVGSARYAAGDMIASKYRLDSVLGEGGMGEVWQAFNVQLEAPVAIKLIRAGLERDLLTKRLKQEARAAAKLGHPAIVRIFDVGETELGDPFIVMELLSGRSLGALLAAERRMPAPQAIQLLLPVADALSVAHAKGIVHRDLKPDNVFIAVEGEQVQPKLVDFGIVKIAGVGEEPAPHLTQVGTVLGSPEYMSPEQARGREDLDHRTDIWSFCVVLYETIVGTAPFVAANYNALLRRIVEEEPIPTTEHLAGDERLWEIIKRGLAKEPERRFQSMTELGCALALWLSAQGIFEDVSGGSLEAKWISRTADPLAPRAMRASLASLATLPPESGVRPADRRFVSAPTIDASAPVQFAEGATGDKARSSWFTLPRLLLVGGATALLLGITWLAARSSPAVEAPTQAPEASHPPEPRGVAAAAPPVTAVAPRVVETAPAGPVVVPSGEPSAPSRGGSHKHPASKTAPKPASPQSAAPTDPSHDLISPY